MGSKIAHNRNMKKYNLARSMRTKKTPVSKIATVLEVSTETIYRWTKGIECPYYNPRYNTDCINGQYFSRHNLSKYPERFVIVGFIAADGCVSDSKQGQRTLCFNLAQKDKIALDMINQEIAQGKRKISLVQKTNSCIISFPSDEICNDLKRFGIVPRKTSGYSIPNLNKIHMQYFLRGYFYGDGCAYCPERASHRMYHFIGTSIFIEKLAEYLVTEKIVPNAPHYKIKNSEYRQMHIKGSKTAAMGQYLFSDKKFMLIPRKHKLLL